MKWERWLEQYAIYPIILIALCAGLAAAYGRELENGRSPNRLWWARRLLILPLLAITATAATDQFGLNASATAFSAAMLSLGGYDVVRLVEARWKKRVLAAAEQQEPS